MIYTASRRASHRFAACVLALAAGLACVGCEEQDTTAAAIERAKLALDRISLPATPVEANDAAAALARIVTDLRPVAGQGQRGRRPRHRCWWPRPSLGSAIAGARSRHSRSVRR